MIIKKILAAGVSAMMIALSAPLSLTANDTVSAETAVWNGKIDISWYDAEETELHISTAEELAGLASLCNNDHKMEQTTIYLDNDIYLNDVTNFENWNTASPENEWTSISTFSGTLNGNGHTIYGLYVTRDTSDINFNTKNINAGFCDISEGTIQNLNFDKSYIFTTQSGFNYSSEGFSSSMYCIGGICGYNAGTIQNCVVSGIIQTVTTPDASAYVGSYVGSPKPWFNTAIGGIAGENLGNILQCENKMTINAAIMNDSGNMIAGGICGKGGGIAGCVGGDIELTNCYNEGQLSGSTTGGIIGHCNPKSNSFAIVRNVYNIGTKTDGDYLTGAIMGYRYDGTCSVENAYYLNTTSLNGAMCNYSPENEGTTAKSAANMKKEAFADSLGDAFVYNEGGYPMLAWEAEKKPVIGDIDLDGTFDITDVKLLQDYLLCRESLTPEQGAAADVLSDGCIDSFDLCMLKRMYAEQCIE